MGKKRTNVSFYQTQAQTAGVELPSKTHTEQTNTLSSEETGQETLWKPCAKVQAGSGVERGHPWAATPWATQA